MPPALNFAHDRAVTKMPFVRNSTCLGSCEKQVLQILSVGFFSEQRGLFPRSVSAERSLCAHGSRRKLPGDEGYCQGYRCAPLRAGFFPLRSTTSDTACHPRKSNRWTDEPGKNTSTFVSSDFLTALNLKGSAFFGVSHISVVFSAYMQNVLFR